jgi:hypothetical protein
MSSNNFPTSLNIRGLLNDGSFPNLSRSYLSWRNSGISIVGGVTNVYPRSCNSHLHLRPSHLLDIRWVREMHQAASYGKSRDVNGAVEEPIPFQRAINILG